MRAPFITTIDFYLFSVAALIRLANWPSSVKVKLYLVNSLSFLAYHLSKSKRRLSEKNLSDTFGGRLSQDQLRTIVKLSFYRFWLEAFSMPLPSVWHNSGMRVQIRGLEHLQQALHNRKGAILWESNSFGRKFLAKQILHQNGFSICQIYGENHAGGFPSPCPASWVRRCMIKRFFDNCEKQYVAEILNLPLWEPLPVVRILFGRLKQNGILCVAGDGTLGWNSVQKEFLGRSRAFFTGMVSLSRSTGAPILPLFCVQEDPDTIAVIIEPSISTDRDIDRESVSDICIERYVRQLECYVKKHPDQYSNWHFQSHRAGDSQMNTKGRD
jgi:lauroyl/myristoyl acyltransferase